MRLIYFIIFFFTGLTAFCQEVVTGLQYNPVVVDKFREISAQKKKTTGEDTIPIALPFFDDFSSGGVFPSTARWIDRFAYVNNDFPLFPVDYGAVTLDAINDSGSIYYNGVPGPQTFMADRLTSRYIRLDSLFTPTPRAYQPSDSLYFSFYYQPQGRGRPPSTSDSLVLQFLIKSKYDSLVTTDTTIHLPEIWKPVWSAAGSSLDTFFIHNNSYFKRVMIPLTDSIYFKKYFRFRFFNYVSLPSNGQPSWQSNCDEWNIDDVYLNSGRSQGDTVHKELRFIERAPTMLKNYTSMPYTQYSNDPSNEMADTISMIMTNRDTIQHSVNYSYYVTSPDGTFNKTFNSSAFVMLPYFNYSFGYLMHPPISFIYPIGSADSALFIMKHVLRDLTPGSTYGDTITGYQKLYNYYSYDDGTPEAGYGLKGTGAMMAYQFKLNLSPDTLRAVRIYFNHTLAHNNQQYFYLTVWNDNNGKPGDTIYSRLEFVNYTDSLNEFYTYRLENPVRISGTFYVGTEQTTDDNLNIGLDLSRNSETSMYFNSTGVWLQSTQGGTLLMRPVIGKPLPVGIESVPVKKQNLAIFPNPCNDGLVHIMIPGKQNPVSDESNWRISVYDLTGRKIAGYVYQETTDISAIPDGIYLVELQHATGHQSYSGKLVVIH